MTTIPLTAERELQFGGYRVNNVIATTSNI